jgi:hypothetical protein
LLSPFLCTMFVARPRSSKSQVELPTTLQSLEIHSDLVMLAKSPFAS